MKIANIMYEIIALPPTPGPSYDSYKRRSSHIFTVKLNAGEFDKAEGKYLYCYLFIQFY